MGRSNGPKLMILENFGVKMFVPLTNIYKIENHFLRILWNGSCRVVIINSKD